MKLKFVGILQVLIIKFLKLRVFWKFLTFTHAIGWFVILQMSDDAHAHISSTGVSVEYRYPNSNVNRLHFKVWKQLLAR